MSCLSLNVRKNCQSPLVFRNRLIFYAQVTVLCVFVEEHEISRYFLKSGSVGVFEDVKTFMMSKIGSCRTSHSHHNISV